MKRKKIFFVLSSLKMGGSQRVYWLLSKYFNKDKFEVVLVLFDSDEPFFPLNIPGVRTVRLDTIRASRSVVKLYQLIKREKPDAIFTTGAQVIIAIALISYFLKVPRLFARESNIPNENLMFANLKAHLIIVLIAWSYKRFKLGICQSTEIRDSLSLNYHIPQKKLMIIPNPVEGSDILTCSCKNDIPLHKLVTVGRLNPVKGFDRLIRIMHDLPPQYQLSIAGEGEIKDELLNSINEMGLQNRVKLLGEVKEVLKLISKNDIMVLTSYTEGFPNVVLESLSVGVPVVSFRVGGVSDIIIEGFNGYIIEQNDLTGFKEAIEKACTRVWDFKAIKQDVLSRYSIERTVSMYESLVN